MDSTISQPALRTAVCYLRHRTYRALTRRCGSSRENKPAPTEGARLCRPGPAAALPDAKTARGLLRRVLRKRARSENEGGIPADALKTGTTRTFDFGS